MKSIKKKLTKKQKLIIYITAGLALIAIGSVFVFRIINKNCVDNWVGDVRQKITTHSSQLQPDSTTDQIHQTISSLSSELEQTPQPFTFTIFELSSERERRESFSNSLNSLTTHLKSVNSEIDYQKSVSSIISDLSGKTSSNLSELEAVEKAYSNSVASLESMQPPTELQETHNDIANELKSIKQDIADLVQLYKGQKRQDFLAKQDSINTKIDNIHKIGQNLDTYLASQDSKLTNYLHVVNRD